jgi:hypothetical protein
MHCKDVSVRDVDFDLTPESISERMADWTAYARCDYLILRNKDGFAALRVAKEQGIGLFRRVKDFEILSLPEDTDYVVDDMIDVLNIPSLALIQSQHPGKGVVIEGMFSHVVFIKDLEPLHLEVVDSIPPSPSKLGVLVKKALDSDFIDLPVIMHETVVDMQSKIPEVRTEGVMFPCKVSGIVADMPTYYLDSSPELKHDVTLIGCSLSKRIFESLYRKDVPFINVCPAEYIPKGKKTIVKCCKIKEGHIIDGDVVKVPWGATVPEIVDAIKDLFSEE